MKVKKLFGNTSQQKHTPNRSQKTQLESHISWLVYTQYKTSLTSSNKHDWRFIKYLNVLHYNRTQKQLQHFFLNTLQKYYQFASICTMLSYFSACKKSTSSLTSFWRYSKEKTNLLFWVICACLATQLKWKDESEQIFDVFLEPKKTNFIFYIFFNWDLLHARLKSHYEA